MATATRALVAIRCGLSGSILLVGRPQGLLLIGVLLFLPGVIYLNLVTIWHWKTRYRGNHSDLWGGLILLETSGWFKLVYLFRHIIPDARGKGRYSALYENQGAQKELGSNG